MNHHSRKPPEKYLLVNDQFLPVHIKYDSPILYELKECSCELSKTKLNELLSNGTMGAEYQPILALDTLKIFAYEGLARFSDPSGKEVLPDIVFASLHQFPSLLFHQEYEQKKFQIKNAPAGEKLFINLDQDSFFAYQGNYRTNPLFILFEEHKNRIVVELTENCKVIDAIGSKKVISILRKNKILSAIDDTFKPNSLFSFDVIPMIDFIKLDKSVVKRTIKDDPDLFKYVVDVINNAHQIGKRLVLEGIENEADLSFAGELGVDFVQGMYFSNQFINKTDLILKTEQIDSTYQQ